MPKRPVRKRGEGASSQKSEAAAPLAKKSLDLSRWAKLAGAVLALILFFTIYVLRLDKVAGLIVDDAWYMLLAKALATGGGYTLINSPSAGIVPFYPPAFPMLLSLVFRISPEFPANITLLKSVSVAAMLGVGVIAVYYFHRQRRLPFYLALGIATATAIYPALVFLATSSLMSECVFSLALLAAVSVTDRVAFIEEKNKSLLYAILSGALASFCFLTRSVALGLIVGAIVYLIKERRVWQAVALATVVTLLTGPWILYSRSHLPTVEQRLEQGGNIIQNYSAQFWHKAAGQPLGGEITIDDVPARIWNNGAEIVSQGFGALAFYPVFRPLEPGLPMRLDREARVISQLLSLFALLGWIWMIRERLTLAEIAVPLLLLIQLLWGWEQFRLLLPLVPFLLFYMLMGMRAVYQLLHSLLKVSKPQAEWRLVTAIVWGICALSIYNNVVFIQKKYHSVPGYDLRWIRAFEENERFFNYVGQTIPKSEVIATQNPALLHLYTGHKAIASDDPAGSWETWNRLGVRYLVRSSPYPLRAPDAAESQYKVIYRHNGSLNLRITDLGEPSSRPVWGAAVPAPSTPPAQPTQPAPTPTRR